MTDKLTLPLRPKTKRIQRTATAEDIAPGNYEFEIGKHIKLVGCPYGVRLELLGQHRPDGAIQGLIGGPRRGGDEHHPKLSRLVRRLPERRDKG